MNTVKTFMNEALGTVRVVNKDGVEWFVAKDVCDILEISNNRDALSRLDDDEKNSVGLTDGNTPKRGNPNVSVINEYGLWQLVLTSRKPQAKEFKHWLTHEVIPAIRKNGGYIDGQEYLSDEERADLEAEVRELHAMVEDYRYQNKFLQDKIDYLARTIERDYTGDFDKRKKNVWSKEDSYDFDVDDYEDIEDIELFSFSDYSMLQGMKAIVNSAKPQYIDKSAARYLISELDRMFVERNA